MEGVLGVAHLLVAVFASWRLTELVTMDRITEPIRRRWPHYLWGCPRCVSVWAGIIVTAFFVFAPWLNWPLAFAWVYLVEKDTVAAWQHHRWLERTHGRPPRPIAGGSASDIYIAQTAAGADDGSSCANAHAVSFFNTAANWGAGATQIGAGTTVHLCGTFTFTAGTVGLTVLGSGTSGSPIVIIFEPNAILQSPYFLGSDWQNNFCSVNCGGAINLVGRSNIIVDGGTNGIIQNTANGTNLANQQYSTGVFIHNSTNLIVRNLWIRQIYMNAGSSPTATDAAGLSTTDIRVESDSPSSDVRLCNNRLENARAGITSYTPSTTGIVSGVNCQSNTFTPGLIFLNNTLDDHAWQIQASGGPGSTSIANNDFGTYVNWQYPVSAYHTDGIIAYGGSVQITIYIWNNYFHGDLGAGSPTGQIGCGYGGVGSGSACIVFNNVLVGVGFGQNNDTIFWNNEQTVNNPMGPTYALNNTFVYGGFHFTTPGDSTSLYTFYNNIHVGDPANNTYNYIQTSALQPFTTLTVNNNVYFNTPAWNWNGTIYTTLATWRTGCSSGGGSGCDSTASTADPLLNTAPYTLQPGSSAIGLGGNLTALASTLGIPPLLIGAPTVFGMNGTNDGVPRPAVGPWDAGAYQTPTAPGVPRGGGRHSRIHRVGWGRVFR